MSKIASRMQRDFERLKLSFVSIMVVEDNDATRRLIIDILRGMGFTNLINVASAEDALANMAAYHPDLIIVDWDMTGISGIELAQKIRMAQRTSTPNIPNPTVPILMLTSRDRAYDVMLARNAGIDEFVLKPCSVNALLKSLMSILLKRRKFVNTEAYVGPDRRRRRREDFKGYLKREEDVDDCAERAYMAMVQEAVKLELKGVRLAVRQPGGISQSSLNMMVRQAMRTEEKAHLTRMRLVEKASASLKDYIEMFGKDTEADVIDVHLDALMTLNDIGHDEVQAHRIVRNLEILVDRRNHCRNRSPGHEMPDTIKASSTR